MKNNIIKITQNNNAEIIGDQEFEKINDDKEKKKNQRIKEIITAIK